MTITPVDRRDKKGIIQMYLELGFIVLEDAVDPRIGKIIRDRIPEYVRQRTNNFAHPFERITEDFHTRSLDLEQEVEDQKVKRWQVCWGYREQARPNELELERILRELMLQYIVGPSQTIKAIAEHHGIPRPKRYLPTLDMYFYRNLSQQRKEWKLPWHTDTTAVLAMRNGEEGVIEVESPITREKYVIATKPNVEVIGFGEKMIGYLRKNSIEPKIAETSHRVVIPAGYETRTSFTFGLQI